MTQSQTVTHTNIPRKPDVKGPTPPKRVDLIRRTDNGKGNEKGA